MVARLWADANSQDGADCCIPRPPYGKADGRQPDLYTTDSLTVADDCRKWAIEHGDDKRLRIALCGYGSQGKGPARANASRERIWFSPHCIAEAPSSMFAGVQ